MSNNPPKAEELEQKVLELEQEVHLLKYERQTLIEELHDYAAEVIELRQQIKKAK